MPDAAASSPPSAGPKPTLLERLHRAVMIGMGEDDAQLPAMEEGRRPFGEYFALARVFDETWTMRAWRPEKMGSLAWQALFSAKCALALRRRPDVRLVYLAEELPGVFALAGLSLLRPDLKKVMLVHNVASRLRTIPLAKLGLVHKLDFVLCLSESSRDILVRQYGVDPAKVVVLGSRVDERFFAVADEPPRKERPLVASAGAINRDYGTLIRACLDLDVDLKIAADTAWRYSQGKKRAEDLPSHPRLEMRSWGTYEKLRELYAAADVVVVPLHEGAYASGQTVILEAMAMGKAVVTSDISGRSDFIEHEVDGLYVPPGDAAALRDAVARLLGDPELRRRLGANAAKKVRARFTVVHYLDRILGACLDALGPEGGAARAVGDGAAREPVDARGDVRRDVRAEEVTA